MVLLLLLVLELMFGPIERGTLLDGARVLIGKWYLVNRLQA